MNASSCLIFLVVVAISTDSIASRSKKSQPKKSVDNSLKHRSKTKKIDALKMKLDDGVDNYWTQCKPQYANPLGVCLAGYHLTEDPTHGNRHTWAKEVDGIWDGTHTFRCPDRPHYEVRYFCSKTFTKSYWQGTAPACDPASTQVSDCQNAGYQGLGRWTSDFGDGNECFLSGKKVLCAKV